MLDVANNWLELLGQPRNASWANIANKLATPFIDPASPPDTPLYSFNAACACAYTRPGQCPPGRFSNKTQCSALTSHPKPAGLMGVLNGLAVGVDAQTANNTVAATVNMWGWGTESVGTNVWGVSAYEEKLAY